MPSAFVTGGTGFIGSHLVEELLDRGYDDVRCLVRTEHKWLDGLSITAIRGELTDGDLIREAVHDVDYVFHNAGVTRAQNWDAFRTSNVDAAIQLLRTVAEVNPDVQRVLITSSLAAVGSCPGGVATEESPLQPVSRYGRSKAMMEKEVRSFRSQLPVVIVRPPAVYGPREEDIFTFFKTVQKGLCPVVGPVHEPVLSLVHVEDLARGMVDAAEAPQTVGETYFIGSEGQYSWNDLKNAATDALGRRALTVSVPPALVGIVGAAVEIGARWMGSYPPLNREKAREIRHACKMCSSDKAQRDFGYRQRVRLREGIRSTIEWYKKEGWL